MAEITLTSLLGKRKVIENKEILATACAGHNVTDGSVFA
jgi:hypothetical protein